MPRVLALDYGSARCGVALSDPSGTIASPLPVIQKVGTPSGMRRLLRLIEDRGVERIVLGLPIGLSGRDTAQTRETRAFAERLRLATSVPVELYDERFTTRLAERDVSAKADEDSRAAAHLLGEWLDVNVAPPLGPSAGSSWEDEAS